MALKLCLITVNILGLNIMKPDRSKKREELSKKLIYLKHEMAKFFDCDATYIKFSDPNYISERPKIEVELMLINREVTSLKKFNTSTYYFDFEVEYIKRE